MRDKLIFWLQLQWRSGNTKGRMRADKSQNGQKNIGSPPSLWSPRGPASKVKLDWTRCFTFARFTDWILKRFWLLWNVGIFYNFPDRVARWNSHQHLYPMYGAGAVVITASTPPRALCAPHPLPGDRRWVSPYTKLAAQMWFLTLVITLTMALHRVSALTCSRGHPLAPKGFHPNPAISSYANLFTLTQPPRTQWHASSAVCLAPASRCPLCRSELQSAAHIHPLTAG